ncbi:Tn3 family transposase [Deinococcus sp. SDU3-2]|uniref:Tn3 family transposase n=1 Tax=Deinococcus terrestris TaxID=2651870 RepID=A0A7X1NZC3_9DEIO|nr:Tn3 family transposase [Deinococcus terrestris]MPY68136.1 Tn3 family transposase [Deinococcus terrestris]
MVRSSESLLTQAQREQFTRFPPLDEHLLSRYYLLGEDDLRLVRERRRDFNRLGFAVQLTVLRHLGRPLRSGETPPEEALAYLAEQLRVDAGCYGQYATRDPTRHEHFASLCQSLGYAELSRRLNDELREWLMPLAVVTNQPFPLMSALMDELRRRKVLVPRFSVLERLVHAARVRADQHTYGLLNLPLKGELPEKMDALLSPQDDEPISRFAWLGRPVGAPKAKHVLALLDRLAFVRTFPVQSNLRAFLPQSRLEHLAEEARRLSASHLGDFEPGRRRATLMAYLFDLSETLTDAVLDMHDRVMVGLLRDGEREAAEVFREQGPPLVKQLGTFKSVCAAVIAAREQGADPYQAIEAVVNWQQLVETVREREVVRAEQLDPLHCALKGYAKVRSYAPRMLASFSFQAEGTAAPLVEALGLLREMYAANKRTLPEHVPIGFVRQKWAGQVFRDGEIDRRAYELCVLDELRLALRAGDVWVTGSRKYKDLDAYLLPQGVWQRQLPELSLSLPETFEAFWREIEPKLQGQLLEVEGLLVQGALSSVTVRGRKLKVGKALKAVPDEVEPLERWLSARVPRVKITDLLLEVNAWTRFTGAFLNLHSGKGAERHDHLLTAILADGLNLGLTKMAEASPDPGVTTRRLMYLADWFLRPDSYAAGLAELVNFQSKLPLAALWGDGTTSSSDGQRFPTGGRGKTFGHLNAKYGREPGVLFYTHVSDQYAPFHTKVITANVRDALHVLDGLLYHLSDLKIKEHYTDTAGYTEQVFALCHLLGFRFAPRIRDLGETRLYTPEVGSAYGLLEPLVAQRLNLRLIREHWDELRRLTVSVKAGTVTASLILSKLASYPRQNGLALALRELGRVQRTLFTLEWLRDPDLRRRVLVGLNKGEALHALKRAVAFHRSGEIRDRSFEAQSNRASGLNLVTTAIAVWNTVYLGRAVESLRAEGVDVPDELLAHVSPLSWEHIGLTGDYVWRPEGVPAEGAYRALCE